MKKNVLIYLIIFLFTNLLTGCDSLFDNEVPPHELVGENAITNESSAETALNGIYSYLGGYGTMSAFYISDNEYRINLLTGTYRGTFEEEGLLAFKLTEEYSYVEDPWSQAYKLINAANNFIYYVEKLDDSKFGNNRKNQMLAEARFMRAFANMFLLRRYGYFWDTESHLGIILRMEPSSLSNNSQGRATVKECYTKIFEDLDYAIKEGPDYYSKYRGCTTLAKAFKADFLMSRGAGEDYTEALRLVNEVIDSKEFSLEENFADIFKNGYSSKELMFTRHLKTPPAMDDNVGSILNMFGGGTYKPTDTYLSILTPEDARYTTTFDSLVLGEGVTAAKQIIWKKHYVENGDCPMYYMRLAQMYLIKAEAMMYTGATVSDILKVLNVLRERSGNTPFNEQNYASTDEVRDEIFYENLREIGMENGTLFNLAVRMKKGGVRKLAELNPNFKNDDQLCFPIPKAELEHNFVVEQKPM